MMTNEMKLLMAMCDAMGFEVETTNSHSRKITRDEARAIGYFSAKPFGYTADKWLVTDEAMESQPRYLIDSDGMYTEAWVKPIVDYKLTKKGVSNTLVDIGIPVDEAKSVTVIVNGVKVYSFGQSND